MRYIQTPIFQFDELIYKKQEAINEIASMFDRIFKQEIFEEISKKINDLFGLSIEKYGRTEKEFLVHISTGSSIYPVIFGLVVHDNVKFIQKLKEKNPGVDFEDLRGKLITFSVITIRHDNEDGPWSEEKIRVNDDNLLGIHVKCINKIIVDVQRFFRDIFDLKWKEKKNENNIKNFADKMNLEFTGDGKIYFGNEKSEITMKDLIFDRICCMAEFTYMHTRLSQSFYKDIKKNFLICDTFNDEELLDFYNQFINLYLKMM